MAALVDLALFLVAAVASAALIVLLRPLFMRYSMAPPNARSSHAVPTPQGGGAAVIAAVILTLGVAGVFGGEDRAAVAGLMPLGAGVVLLTVVGAVADMFAVQVAPRLALQAIAVIIVVAPMPTELRVAPALPLMIERAAEIVAGLCLVNFTNFMDGIDWMTVAETVPIAASLFAFSLAGAVPRPAGLMALALCGAMLGFAPFNRPVARLFLGDVGSLPVGLMLFFMLTQLAAAHLAAALLLPLYHLADAGITLMKRMARGENITRAHRSHFYQLATARGFSVHAVVGRVFAVNAALAILAAVSIWQGLLAIDIAALVLGGTAVATLLAVMSRGRR